MLAQDPLQVPPVSLAPDAEAPGGIGRRVEDELYFLGGVLHARRPDDHLRQFRVFLLVREAFRRIAVVVDHHDSPALAFPPHPIRRSRLRRSRRSGVPHGDFPRGVLPPTRRRRRGAGPPTPPPGRTAQTRHSPGIGTRPRRAPSRPVLPYPPPVVVDQLRLIDQLVDRDLAHLFSLLTYQFTDRCMRASSDEL